MATNYESENLALRLWFLTHRIRDLLRRCEDQIFAEYGLTTEQYGVLAVMKCLDEPIRITDIAWGLDRSTNSVSMIVDRMVKAGLVRRVRDRSDRRAVRVIITSKAENALKPAVVAGWEFIRESLSQLSYEDRRTFVNLHEKVKYKALEYLNPGGDIEEMMKNDITSQANLLERLVRYTSSSTPKAKRQGVKKKKAI